MCSREREVLQYPGRRLHTGAIRPWVGVWCVLLLLLSAPSLLADAAEEQAYTAVQQAMATGAHARAVSDARAFLQHFPDSAERPRVLFWLADALYATRAYREAAAIYQGLLHETPM